MNGIRVRHIVAGLVLLGGCDQPDDITPVAPQASTEKTGMTKAANPLRNAYFGDLHIHTTNSSDAYNVGVRATPDDAYRYAKGETVTHPLGYPMRLRGGALDFYGVTDHAENMGLGAAYVDPESLLSKHPLVIQRHTGTPKERQVAQMALASPNLIGKPVPGLDVEPVISAAWQENIEAAERHNLPGEFTAFIGYEYSSQPGGANLHRNVIFEGSEVPAMPFGAGNGNPEALWRWMDTQRGNGIEALAIPHNANWSRGLMFERSNIAGEPIDTAYADLRARNEPLVEITQVKGTSETHPTLSSTDEWADFEIWRKSSFVITMDGNITRSEGATSGAYARDALRTGLELEQSIGNNPYQFGFIGSTDGHNAASPIEEDQYFAKLGVSDGSPEARGSVPAKNPKQPVNPALVDFSASGLAGVWAEENTRASIFAALRRKETFATTGPRIKLRFFAGYNYSKELIETHDAIAEAYADGVPMGGDLAAMGDTVPQFLIWALRDPRESWLQRAQIVKGWMEGGESHERVFDVACSDGLTPDPETHRCPDNGATVDITDCSTTLDKGATELKAVWQDPTFNTSQRAFYYVRVLQNPTCRWTAWDALRAGIAPREDVAATLQERAWSSPIWYEPAR